MIQALGSGEASEIKVNSEDVKFSMCLITQAVTVECEGGCMAPFILKAWY